MRTLPFVVILGCAAVSYAQQPQSFTPSTPPRAGEETIVNARVVSMDPAGSRITVRGVDVKADGGRDETYTVSPRATAALTGLKAGAGVLLVLRGTTVVEVRPSAAPASAAPAAPARRAPATRRPARVTPARGAGTARTPAAAVTPAPAVSPVSEGPAPVPGVVIDGTAPIVQITPVPQGAATPFPTPRAVPTPIPVAAPPSVGTPAPVLVPPSTPPSPASTPASTPSPVTSPVTQ